MKTKKLFGVAALTALATLGLVACGGGEEEEKKPDPKPSTSKEIEFYTSMGDKPREILDPMVEAFNAKQTTYKVKVVNPGGGYDGTKEAVNSAIQGNTQPAISYCYPDHVAEYLPTGKVINMMDFIKDPELGFTAEEIADFIPGFWEEGYKAFGKDDTYMYTLPFSKSTEAMYYNPVALKKLYPSVTDITTKVPKTWDELWQIAEDLKNCSDPELKKWYAMGYDSESNWFITYDEQKGIPYTSTDESEHYTFNNAQNLAFLQDLEAKFKKGYFTTKELYGNYTSDLFTAPNDAGVSTIFSIGSTAGANHQKSDLFDAEVTTIPQVDPAHPKSISQGPNLVMLKQGDPEKEKVAWLFVKELLKPEFQAAFARAQGYMPVRISTRTTGEFAEWLKTDDLIAKTMSLAIEQMDNYFVSPAFNGSNKAREQVGAALIATLTGIPAEQALQDAYDEASF